MIRFSSTATLACALVCVASLTRVMPALASPAHSEARQLLDDWQLEAATEACPQGIDIAERLNVTRARLA